MLGALGNKNEKRGEDKGQEGYIEKKDERQARERE